MRVGYRQCHCTTRRACSCVGERTIVIQKNCHTFPIHSLQERVKVLQDARVLDLKQQQ